VFYYCVDAPGRYRVLFEPGRKPVAYEVGESCTSPKPITLERLDSDKVWPGRCVEFNGTLPMSSEHLWASGLRGEPIGNCLRCGESIFSYHNRCARLMETPEMQAKLREHAIR
jgi:hypothetical protein